MPEAQIEACATHGLRYDASQYDGCVLCRRAAQPPEEPRETSRSSWVWIMGAVAVLGAASVFYFGARSGVTLAPDIGATDPGCVRTHVGAFDGCVRGCRGVAYGTCPSKCALQFDSEIRRCAQLPALKPGEKQLLGGVGALPAWDVLRPSLSSAVAAMVKCPPDRAGFVARVHVRPNAAPRVIAASMQRDAIECVEGTLAAMQTDGWPRADYAFVLRGLEPIPPPPPPPPPKPTTAKPETPVDYLAQVNAMSDKAAQTAEATEIAAGEDALRQLKAIKATCAQGDWYASECKSLLNRLAPSFPKLFKELPVAKQFGATKWTEATINSTGAGVDCLRCNAKAVASSREANAVFAAAVPNGRRIHWSPALAFGVIGDSSWNRPIDVTNAPWPSSFTGTRTHIDMFDAGEHLLCFSIDDDKPATVYAAVAAYDEAPPLKPDGVPIEASWETNDQLALALTPRTLEALTVADALHEGNVEAIKRMIARRVPMESAIAPSALATALYNRWPLDQVQMLVRAGAKPNAVSNVLLTGLTALMHRLSTSVPKPEADRDVAAAAKQLIAAGADPNLTRSSDGNTPLHLARKYEGPMTAAVLIAAGANPAARNAEGQTPAQIPVAR